MKKNDLILLIGTFLFSFLFYKQSAGLNVFIFSLIMPALLAAYKPVSLKNKLWIFGAVLTIMTGFSVFANATFLSVFAFYAAITYLAGVTVSQNASPLSAITYGSFSYITSFGFMISDSIERKKANEDKVRKKIQWNAILFLGIFIAVIVMVFFFLYQSANPLFKELTKFINLDFISFRWIMFTFMGFLLVYGFLYTRKHAGWNHAELNPNFLIHKEKINNSSNRLLWFHLDEQLEKKAGIILFLCLNIMILIINVLDISYLWTGVQLPEGFTFAGYLHQGIYTLIFSCVLAILLILLIFRGKLNFVENNKFLKVLAQLWIVQNIFISLSCAFRNYIYISNYALTYKRIVIYLLLILLVAGLITTIIKIIKSKNTYFLFRKNSYVILIVFILFSFFNWDGIIAKYNINNSEYPDISYLLDKNNSTLPHLLQYAETVPHTERSTDLSVRERPFYTPESVYWQGEALTDRIYNKTIRLIEQHEQTSWKSTNLSDIKTIRLIRKMYREGTLKQFVIANNKDININLLKEFKGLQRLSIRNSKFSLGQNPENLLYFAELRELELSGMDLEHIEGLPTFNHLQSINISNNNIHDFSKLSVFQNLNKLNISSNPVEETEFIETLTGIESLDISRTHAKDLQFLSKLPKLKILYLSAIPAVAFETLPVCNTLEEIDLSDNSGLNNYASLRTFLSGAPNLARVTLHNTGLSSLSFFSDTIVFMNRISLPNNSILSNDVSHHITYLDISQNSLSNLNGIQIFNNLIVLHASDNSISDIRQIKHCRNLIELDLSNNPLYSLEGIEQLKDLKYAHFSGFSFSDIGALAELPKLEALTLEEGFIEATDVFTNMKTIKYLDLSNTILTSLAFLNQLPELEFLNLSGYTGNDLEQIQFCTSLKVVVLPPVPMKLKRKLEQEIPQLKIIRDWEFETADFYKSKYGVLGSQSY